MSRVRRSAAETSLMALDIVPYGMILVVALETRMSIGKCGELWKEAAAAWQAK